MAVILDMTRLKYFIHLIMSSPGNPDLFCHSLSLLILINIMILVDVTTLAATSLEGGGEAGQHLMRLQCKSELARVTWWSGTIVSVNLPLVIMCFFT